MIFYDSNLLLLQRNTHAQLPPPRICGGSGHDEKIIIAASKKRKTVMPLSVKSNNNSGAFLCRVSTLPIQNPDNINVGLEHPP